MNLELAQPEWLPMWIFVIIALAMFIFVIWMIIDMFLNKKLKGTEKGLWFIAFIIASILTAIVWLIVRK